MSALDKFLSDVEVCQLINVNQRTLDNMKRFGLGPKYTKGYGFAMKDVVAWAGLLAPTLEIEQNPVKIVDNGAIDV